MVLLQRLQRLLERARSLLDVLGLLGRQLVEVLVDRIRRLDAVADAVQAGHQLRGEGQVRVAGGIRGAELQALGLGVGAGDRDADAGGAVALRVDHVDRGLEALHQAAVGVHRGVGEGQHGRGVLEQPADVPASQVGEPDIALLVVEQRLAVLPQRLVAVHAGAVVVEDRLGHEGGGLAPGRCGVLHDVLELLQVVGRVGQGVEAVVDLRLAGSADLVVGALDLQADLVQGHGDGVAQIRLLVRGGDREVAAFHGPLVGQVAALLPATGVPRGLVGVHGVEGALRLDVVADVLEDEELGLGGEVRGVRDAGGAHVGLGALGHAAGIAVVGLAAAGVDDRAGDVERLLDPVGVHERRGHVRDELHVGLGDAGETADRGAVEELPVHEEVVVDGLGGEVEVLLDPRHVGEPDVDEDDVLLLDEGEDLFCCLEHCVLLHGVGRPPCQRSSARRAEPLADRLRPYGGAVAQP